ncbi:MAG: polysaccharide pyruvyl transferase family protein, partial [Eubacteriales bacterium]|nr:polysaccharide pyruvyl transferase family protein [Eubacteriales bacterium]
MRIGILTFHKPINYGAFLQAFALSTQLSNKFKESHVEIIDYIAPLEKKKIFINVLWGVKHYGFLNGIRDLYKINSFNNAYKVLALSQKNHFDDLNDLYKFIDNTYDLLIIGSDAVFNWKQNGYPTAFIPIYSFKRCKVVSYAASVHGLRYLDEPKGRIDECGQSFDKMSL